MRIVSDTIRKEFEMSQLLLGESLKCSVKLQERPGSHVKLGMQGM